MARAQRCSHPDECGWDKSKISRIENAKVSLSRHDLHRLCDLYGAEPADATRMEAMLTEAHGPRWWANYLDVINSTYEEFICLESQASCIHSADASIILGLLQTRDYAAAALNSGSMIPDPDRADAMAEVRVRRQRLLGVEDPTQFNAVMSAAVLHCEIGGPGVLIAQLDHLVTMSRMSNVTIRIIPTASPAGAYIGGLTLFDFPEANDPSVLFIEHHGGMLVKEDDRDIRRYRRWYVLDAVGAEFWRGWAAGRDFEDSVTAVADRHPDVDRGRIGADGRALLTRLAKRGLVVAPGSGTTTAAEPRAAELARLTGLTGRAKRVHPPTADAHGRVHPAAALAALLAAALLVRLPFALLHRMVRATRVRWCHAPEAMRRAEQLVVAVQQAARRFPGRAACLEVSLAAVLWSAVRRRRLDWCLGAVADPYRFHAWVECEGAPVTASVATSRYAAAPAADHTFEVPEYTRVLSV